MKHVIIKTAVLLFSVALSTAALAGLSEGLTAYDKKNYATALKELKPFAQKGNAEAQFKLGAMYGNGLGVERDVAEAVNWYRKAAEQGNAEGQFYLGLSLAYGQGVTKNEAEAVKWCRKAEVNFRKLAELENADGQLYLGSMYGNGLCVTEDGAEAVKWYRKAAEQGNAEGQFYLGWAFANGLGVTKDEAEAVKWYRKAAERGNADGQFYLGLAFANGQGVPKDGAGAVKWFRKAAELGNANGQYYLGWAIANGQGVAKDEAEAVKWYRKAAEQDNADGQYYLGWAIANGQGVAKDGAEAVKWFRKAAEQGQVNATNYLNEIARSKSRVLVEQNHPATPQEQDKKSRVPTRPTLPFTLRLSEDIWRTIEASEAYRNFPRPPVVEVNYKASAKQGWLGEAFIWRLTQERIPLGDKCFVERANRFSSLHHTVMCGTFDLGSMDNNGTVLSLKSLDIQGSLFPMRVGAEQSVRKATSSSSGTKFDKIELKKQRVIRKGLAHDIDPTLTGVAWTISTEASSQMPDSDYDEHKKVHTTVTEDYFIEDLGVFLSDIAKIYDSSKKKYVLPKPGSQVEAYTFTLTFESYDWKVAEGGLALNTARRKLQADGLEFIEVGSLEEANKLRQLKVVHEATERYAAESRQKEQERAEAKSEARRREKAESREFWKGAATLATGIAVGKATSGYTPDQQTQMMKSAMNAVDSGDASEFSATAKQVKAEQAQSHKAKMQAIEAQKERDRAAAQRAQEDKRNRQAQANRIQFQPQPRNSPPVAAVSNSGDSINLSNQQVSNPPKQSTVEIKTITVESDVGGTCHARESSETLARIGAKNKAHDLCYELGKGWSFDKERFGGYMGCTPCTGGELGNYRCKITQAMYDCKHR